VTVFLDTNIIVYHLTDVDPSKRVRCSELLRRAERNEIDLHATELTIAEVVWFLQYRLGSAREDVRDALLPIVRMPGLSLPNKLLWPAIFELYCEKRVDFVDAYNAVMMARSSIDEIYSYDRDFDRIGNVTRITP
jgi:predicted nucleic acid-binding protein